MTQKSNRALTARSSFPAAFCSPRTGTPAMQASQHSAPKNPQKTSNPRYHHRKPRQAFPFEASKKLRWGRGRGRRYRAKIKATFFWSLDLFQEGNREEMTFTSRKLSCAHPSAPQGRDVCESLKIIKLELELEKGTVSRHGRLGSN